MDVLVDLDWEPWSGVRWTFAEGCLAMKMKYGCAEAQRPS